MPVRHCLICQSQSLRIESIHEKCHTVEGQYHFGVVQDQLKLRVGCSRKFRSCPLPSRSFLQALLPALPDLQPLVAGPRLSKQLFLRVRFFSEQL